MKFIALLRGINVGGKNKIPMKDLCNMLIELGFKDILTYIQSGNILFHSQIENQTELCQLISEKIQEKTCFSVQVVVMTLNELKNVIQNNPFVLDNSKNKDFFHVTFLSDYPVLYKIKTITESTYIPDEFIVSEKAVYLYCPQGYGNTKLTNTFFEKKSGVTATTRNWRTTNELLHLALSMPEF
jgi:uncharacterized protein (DUF1697 family)